MTRRLLTDEEIAESLLRSGVASARPERGTRSARAMAQETGPGAGERAPCPHEDRLWDLARGALSPAEAAEILDHTVNCPDCILALRVAHETFAVSGLALETRGASAPSSRLWSLLAGSLLHPAPALAYLVLLLLSFPIYRLLMPTPTPTPGTIEGGRAAIPSAQSRPGEPSTGTQSGVSNGSGAAASRIGALLEPGGAGALQEPGGTGALPEPGGAASPAGSSIATVVPRLRSLRVLRLTGDLSLRSGTTESAPVRIHLAKTDALMLKLFPDVEDLPTDRTAALLVRVLDGGSVVAEAPIRVSDLEADQSLSMLLDRERLRAGTTYRVEVTTSPAATAGPPLFRQSFRLDEP